MLTRVSIPPIPLVHVAWCIRIDHSSAKKETTKKKQWFHLLMFRRTIQISEPSKFQPASFVWKIALSSPPPRFWLLSLLFISLAILSQRNPHVKSPGASKTALQRVKRRPPNIITKKNYCKSKVHRVRLDLSAVKAKANKTRVTKIRQRA